MITINKSYKVKYSAEQMFDLVNDIESYPEFLPMCQKAKIINQTDIKIEASLNIVKGPINLTFMTENTMVKNEKIYIKLLKGPFKSLNGDWHFISDDDNGCTVNLVLNFEFSNRIISMTLGPIFNNLANTMLDVFCKRAVEVYR